MELKEIIKKVYELHTLANSLQCEIESLEFSNDEKYNENLENASDEIENTIDSILSLSTYLEICNGDLEE